MDTAFHWPGVGDRLFDSDDLGSKTAYVAPMDANWMVYAEGYATAAETTVANVNDSDRNRIVYPVIYLYRHAIELGLKYTLLIARQLLDRSGGLQKGHSLNNVWCLLKPLLEEIWEDDSTDDLKAVDALIREMDQNDRNAEKFRYPISKDGKRFFGSEEFINLEVFCKSGRKILTFLDACSTGIGEYLQVKCEMRDAYGSY